MNTVRMLGIDPGLRVTGFGLIEKQGTRLCYVASGAIKTNAKESLPERLKTLHLGIGELVREYQPSEAAIEIVFVNVNPQSTLLLGQARGALIGALVASDLEVSEYTALQIKQAVVGKGHAAKTQVQHMVVRLLNLSDTPSPDAADALACAITHAHGGAGLGKDKAGKSLLETKGFRVKRGRLV